MIQGKVAGLQITNGGGSPVKEQRSELYDLRKQ
jgi:hypothetical protein